VSERIDQFFAMSGYAFYVWWSFGIGFGIVILNVVLARAALRRAERDARRRLEMQP
jgi:heme exporter protein CcmD